MSAAFCSRFGHRYDMRTHIELRHEAPLRAPANDDARPEAPLVPDNPPEAPSKSED